MRLKDSEIRKILAVIEDHSHGSNADVYLFGSRLDDTKKGGDIDLLIVAEESFKSQLLDKKGRLKSDLSQSLGDQRVDVTICSQNEIDSDAFLRVVYGNAIKLSICGNFSVPTCD